MSRLLTHVVNSVANRHSPVEPLNPVGGRPRLVIIGGPDISNRRPLVALLAHAFDVTVFGSEHLDDGFSAEGSDYHNYHLARSVNPISDAITTNQLRCLLRSLKPDVVHAYDTKPTVLGRLAARLAGVPVVVGTLPGLGSLYSDVRIRTRLIRYIYERLQKQACRLSDMTVFQNDDDLAEFVARKVVRLESATVIRGSGVDTTVFCPGRFGAAECMALRKEVGIAAGVPVITMVSRGLRSKGVLDFAESARIVNTSAGVHGHFLLVGQPDTDSRDALTASEWEKVQRSVHCLGGRTDVAAILAITDIFVLPSYYREGIPRALLEAAASGNALITTDYPGCRDVVRHDLSGLIVPPRQPKRLAEATAQLLTDPIRRTRLGMAARQVAVAQFDLHIVADRIGQLYLSLLVNRRARA